MSTTEFANRVLRMHYGVEEDGQYKNKWVCPEADDFPATELKLRREKTRGHGVVEYSWDCPKHENHCVREILFDTKSMKVVEPRS